MNRVRVPSGLMVILLVGVLSGPRAAESGNSNGNGGEAAALPGERELIDIPTADVVEYGSFWLNFRVYDGGGVLSRLNFGVIRRLNLGGGLDAAGLIGSSHISVRAPRFQIKWRFYDGNVHLPALALGYDAQGLGRFTTGQDQDEYSTPQKGIYLVGTKEVLVENMEFTGGVNAFNRKRSVILGSDVRGFFGLSYLYGEQVLLMTEVDQIGAGSRTLWNTGIRYHATPSFSVEFAVRDLVGGSDRLERVVRVDYTGSF